MSVGSSGIVIGSHNYNTSSVIVSQYRGIRQDGKIFSYPSEIFFVNTDSEEFHIVYLRYQNKTQRYYRNWSENLNRSLGLRPGCYKSIGDVLPVRFCRDSYATKDYLTQAILVASISGRTFRVHLINTSHAIRLNHCLVSKLIGKDIAKQINTVKVFFHLDYDQRRIYVVVSKDDRLLICQDGSVEADAVLKVDITNHLSAHSLDPRKVCEQNLHFQRNY